jgi:nickel-dependent lactate racemase
MKFMIPANEWYGDEPISLDFPDSWIINEQKMAGHDAKMLSSNEILTKLGNPIGAPSLSKLAEGKKKCVIIFDDMTRPTKTYQMLPAVLKELKKGGLKEEQIVFVMATGAHGGRMLFDFQKKLGENIPERFLVFNHNPYENLVNLGKTSHGTPVLINREVMSCDLKITLGAIMPHFGYGFGGGSKMLLPGVSGIDSITPNHHINDGTGPGCIDENIRRLDSEEAARMAEIDFVINALMNADCDVADIVCGDLIEAHRAASNKAREHYVTKVIENADICIGNGYPMANEGYKAYRILEESIKEGGDLVFLLFTPEGCRVHYYNGRFGTDFGGRGWKPDVYVKDPWKMGRVSVVTPNILKADEYYYGKGSIWMRSWSTALDMLKKRYRKKATVALYPTAAMQISEKNARNK